MSVWSVVMKAFTVLRTEGAASLVGKISVNVRASRRRSAFDQMYGTDTSGLVAASYLGSDGRYQAAEPADIKKAIESLGIAVPEFDFVDLGCGKGLPLLVAARLGFRHVHGVEMARSLVAIAERNLQMMHIANASVDCGVAQDWRVPAGKVVVYMYHPFPEQVMTIVRDRIARSGNAELRIVYLNPVCGRLFEMSDDFVMVQPPDARMALYRLSPKAIAVAKAAAGG